MDKVNLANTESSLVMPLTTDGVVKKYSKLGDGMPYLRII